jgi:protein PsiE
MIPPQIIKIFEKDMAKGLHWTTVITERAMLAVIGALTVIAASFNVYSMIVSMKIELADLFLLFIYTEIVGMVGAYYISNRIPVTLPIIIAMTALCRLIILHSKDANPWVLVAEAGAIVVLAGAAYLMSAKEKLSLEKKEKRKKEYDAGFKKTEKKDLDDE